MVDEAGVVPGHGAELGASKGAPVEDQDEREVSDVGRVGAGEMVGEPGAVGGVRESWDTLGAGQRAEPGGRDSGGGDLEDGLTAEALLGGGTEHGPARVGGEVDERTCGASAGNLVVGWDLDEVESETAAAGMDEQHDGFVGAAGEQSVYAVESGELRGGQPVTRVGGQQDQGTAPCRCRRWARERSGHGHSAS